MDEKEVTEPTDKHPLVETSRIAMGFAGIFAGGPIFFFGALLLLFVSCTACSVAASPLMYMASAVGEIGDATSARATRKASATALARPAPSNIVVVTDIADRDQLRFSQNGRYLAAWAGESAHDLIWYDFTTEEQHEPLPDIVISEAVWVSDNWLFVSSNDAAQYWLIKDGQAQPLHSHFAHLTEADTIQQWANKSEQVLQYGVFYLFVGADVLLKSPEPSQLAAVQFQQPVISISLLDYTTHSDPWGAGTTHSSPNGDFSAVYESGRQPLVIYDANGRSVTQISAADHYDNSHCQLMPIAWHYQSAGVLYQFRCVDQNISDVDYTSPIFMLPVSNNLP